MIRKILTEETAIGRIPIGKIYLNEEYSVQDNGNRNGSDGGNMG